MTDFVTRKEAALALLGRTGIWGSSYAPPLSRILWALGFKARPPHFNSFATNFMIFGTYFAVFMSVTFFYLQRVFVDFGSQAQSHPVAVAVISGVGAGLMFGLAMAGYFAWSAGKFRLPRWENL